MKKIIVLCTLALCLTAAPLWAADSDSTPAPPPGNEGYDGGQGMMGPGYGGGNMGPGMMGPGYDDDYMGPGMMGPGMMGPGMMGPGYGRGHMGGYYGRGQGYRMGPSYQGWQNMTPEQREELQKMRRKFMRETLPLRQELTSKQMELDTLWQEPQPDRKKIEELSKEVAELRSKLLQQRDHYLLECRENFGDRGWSCPGW
ncbi:MAG: periplasmic heavy metal sensor [Deltaproteobacteria bacterium]|nr:periplasmic heavy metal sensor [Deltaproteobacteria bacterium]